METVQTELAQLIKEVAELTDNNCHTDSLLTIARYFANPERSWLFKERFAEQAPKLETIMSEHIKAGQMTPDLLIRRGDIHTAMFKQLKPVLPATILNRLREAL